MNVLKGAIKMIKKYKPVMCEIYYKNLNKDQMREFLIFFMIIIITLFVNFILNPNYLKLNQLRKV